MNPPRSSAMEIQIEKKIKYTRTRKSAFYFSGKLYFRMAFRKLFLNGQREKTEGCKREKESKGWRSRREGEEAKWKEKQKVEGELGEEGLGRNDVKRGRAEEEKNREKERKRARGSEKVRKQNGS